MRYNIYLRLAYRSEPFMEEVGNYMFNERGDLRLYDKGKMWHFPASVIQYLFISEVTQNEWP